MIEKDKTGKKRTENNQAEGRKKETKQTERN